MKKILNELEAYHGSPYDFDKFQVKYLGKGEGAQAHGYGLYFALNPDISEKYRERLSNEKGIESEIEYNGKKFNIDSIQGILLKSILKSKEIFLETIQAILSDKEWIRHHRKILPKLQKVLTIAQKIKPEKIKKLQDKIILRKGQFYTVEIPELKYFIREDKPLDKQTKEVQKIINMYHLNEYDDWNYYISKDRAIYFRSCGIIGMYYIGEKDGKCVTIFDDKDIKIKSKKFDYNKKDNNKKDNNIYNDNLNKSGYNLQFCSDEIKKLALINNPYNIKYLYNPSEEEQLLAYKVRKEGNFSGYPIVYYLDNPCKKLQELTVKENPSLIKYFKIYPPEDIQLLAIKLAKLPEFEDEYIKHGWMLNYIKYPTEKAKIEAIKNWKNAIEWIDNPSENVIKEYEKLYGKYKRKSWLERSGTLRFS